MAKIRSIKPEFWADEKLASIPIQARLLFIGTWSYADDNGVLRGNPAYIKSLIFPYDDNLRVGEVKRWIDALVEARMLIPFMFKGESYYMIRTFRSHQRIDTRYLNELIPSSDLEAILPHVEPPTSPRRGPDEPTALEVEVDMEVDNTPYIPLSGDGIDSSDSKFSVKRQKEKKEKVARKRKELDISIVKPTFQPIVADWLAYKSERGQTYQQRGFEAFYRKLTELSSGSADTARSIIEQSMANNWAGIFSIKTNDYGRNTKNDPPSNDALAAAVANGIARANTRQEWEL